MFRQSDCNACSSTMLLHQLNCRFCNFPCLTDHIIQSCFWLQKSKFFGHVGPSWVVTSRVLALRLRLRFLVNQPHHHHQDLKKKSLVKVRLEEYTMNTPKPGSSMRQRLMNTKSQKSVFPSKCFSKCGLLDHLH